MKRNDSTDSNVAEGPNKEKIIQKKCKKFLNDLLSNSGIMPDKSEKFVFTKQSTYTIDRNLDFKKEVDFVLDKKFSLKNEIVVNELITKLSNSEWKEHYLLQNFKPEIGMQVKQRYDPINEIEKLNGEKAPRTYTVDEGKVCLIFIWSIYWPASKKQFMLLNDMYVASWESDVKLISINIDSNSRSNALKYVNSLKLPNFEHYYVDISKYPGHQLHHIIKICNPISLLINTEGLIDFVGSILEIDICDRIKRILSRTGLKTDLNPNQFTTDIEKKNLKVFIKNLEKRTLVLKDKELLLAPHLFKMILTVTKSYIVGTMAVHKYEAELFYHLNNDDEFELDRVLFKGINLLKKLSITTNFVETIPFSPVDVPCKSCEDDISAKTYYYCVFCDVYWCKACGDQISNVYQPEHLHNHFMFLIRPSSTQAMKYILQHNEENEYSPDFKYFNDNIVSKDFITLNSNHFQVKCDGCLVFPIKTIRWKCANCFFKNLCNDCMIMCENKFLYSNEVSKRLMFGGCDPMKHVFQKIVFDGYVV